jgi:hypothetical protein
MSLFSWLFNDPLPVSSLAPDFPELAQHPGQAVLLVFYPGDDTPT